MRSWAKFGKVGTGILAASMLAGCMDVTMELDVLDTDTVTRSMEMVMDADMYAMTQAQGMQTEFCADEGEVLTVSEQNVTCQSSETVSFATFLEEAEEQDEPSPILENIGNGQVLVTLPTATLFDEFGGDMGPQELAMMQAMFEGRTLSLIVGGGEIVETNMDISADGQSAFLDILFTDLMSNNVDLPDESYVILDVE